MKKNIIPASWYFEGEHITAAGGRTKTGAKYLIQANGSDMTHLAGLYRIQEYWDLKYPVFSVLTRESSKELRKLHDRLPLILPENIIGEWIDPAAKAEDMLQFAKTDVIIEKA